MNIREYMNRHLLYLDGGMGTLLQERGLAPGELPELWNLTHADVIEEIHFAYYEAGSHVVSTNTFGANLLKFSESELDKIVGAAVQNARRAQQKCGRSDTWVALDIGPSGRMLKPYGDFDFEEAVRLFAHTARLGVKYGVDLIFLETLNDSYETKAALLGVKETCDLPVFVSNAYGEDGKLMTGADPLAMVSLLEGMGVDALGVNCSLGPKALFGVVEQYLRYASLPVLMKPNAGLPHAQDGKTVFDVGAEEFAADLDEMVRRGVRILGGCCGTTPEHIRRTAEKTKHTSPMPLSDKKLTCVSSYTHGVLFGEEPVLIGERINPTGKKRFKEALRSQDVDYILKEAIAQEEQGAHVLDVNVGLPEIDEPTLLRRVVCELQTVTALPLQIDTSDPIAMEGALRRYNGKALINSVNGKKESMDAVFPLAKKYGGVIVALTLDEAGIPALAEDRVAIARRILKEAEHYGLGAHDFIFDPLALTVSADSEAAKQTLRAVRMIREELGCHTSLGVSNISFGLPNRDLVNGAFFTLALGAGLSAAIMNPYSAEMQKAYHTFRILNGLDPSCADYIEFASALPTSSPVVAEAPRTPSEAPTEENSSELRAAIEKGRKERAAELCRTMIAETPPLTIVEEEVIPALNAVGVGFEKKTVYLPQLLMSAEAAKAAFEVIKDNMPVGQEATKGTIVLATVKGDIHDIGKNIVKLLLENYGFSVHDLGRDVPPEEVVAETVRLHAPVVGLSALMTTTVPAMEETIRQLRAEAPWCRVMVGGAVLTAEYASAIGADVYSKDAMEAVRRAQELFDSLN